MITDIELLSPAGDFEKLNMAVTYGADAVYLAGKLFGMRASAGNFTNDELIEAVKLCHDKHIKVYLTCNTLPRENELSALPDFLSFVDSIGIDAIIAADFGVISLIKQYAPHVALHISTQFGVVNSETAKALFDYGADTVVLARELSIDEIDKIRSNTPKELRLEAFVHGAMCVSFSGRCLLSNYLTGRDSNRGECAQPCRWKFALTEEKRPGEFFPVYEDNGTYIFNSRDMCMIDHLKDLYDAGISSFKIEGRMKSSYYNAVITNAYRQAINSEILGVSTDNYWLDEVNMVSHRPYSTGFYYGFPGQHYSESSYITGADVLAVVCECDNSGLAVMEQRNKFKCGDRIQLLCPGKKPISFTAGELRDVEGTLIEDTRHAAMLFSIKLPEYAPRFSLLRKVN